MFFSRNITRVQQPPYEHVPTHEAVIMGIDLPESDAGFFSVCTGKITQLDPPWAAFIGNNSAELLLPGCVN
jgi:hypothetical protein